MRRLAPPLEAWFRARFARRSEIQRRALPHTLAGANTLILAPTGSGKTLAAFLSVLDALSRRDPLPNAVCAVYVSPLRSLTRDIARNLIEPLAALNAARRDPIRIETRTGDTPEAERARQQRRRPHLLLTTPESLSSLLSQAGWRDGFAAAAVIVDEIHALAESKRGSLLALTLERLEERCGPLQRIGLSATAHPVETVRALLCGARPCAVAAVNAARAHRLEIAQLAAESVLPPANWSPYPVAHTAARIVSRSRCCLLFTATRSGAERLSLALRVLLPELESAIATHHGSIGREERGRIEDALAAGAMRAVVCSTSLELGVDFQGVDHVLLIGAPRGVSRAIQRLGRSGHRIRGAACGSLVPLSLPDLLQCIALREAVRRGRLDCLQLVRQPLDVLAQVVLGMAVEREWELDAAFAVLRRAGPYRELARADFDAVVEYLAGGGAVLAGYGERYGKLRVRDGKMQIASRQAARAYYQNLGVISDDLLLQVVGRNGRTLGYVEEAFAGALRPDEAFVIGGKAVRVRSIAGGTALVEPAAGEKVRTPRWLGGKMSLSAGLAREELALRRGLRDAWERGGARACRAWLRAAYRVSPQAASLAADFIARQMAAAPLPLEEPVQIERIRKKNNLTLIVHAVAGRAVNRSLAWVAAERLGESAGSVVSNFDDHGFLLSLDARRAPDIAALRACFAPEDWPAALRRALESTDLLGRRFRPVAETGQLLPRQNSRGPAGRRAASWSGPLLYQTFRRHEPDHPLLRETVRETLEGDCDAARAAAEAARIHAAAWLVLDLPRPSPFALPLMAAFSREVLVAADPDRAAEEWAAEQYAAWNRG